MVRARMIPSLTLTAVLGCSLIDFRDGIPCASDADCDGYVCSSGKCRDPESSEPMGSTNQGRVEPVSGSGSQSCSASNTPQICYDESCRAKCGEQAEFTPDDPSKQGLKRGLVWGSSCGQHSGDFVGTIRTYRLRDGRYYDPFNDPAVCVYSFEFHVPSCDFHLDCSDR